MKRIIQIALIVALFAGSAVYLGAQVASACEWYEDCGSGDSGWIITNTNDNYNFSNNTNTNTNNIGIITNSGGGSSGGGSGSTWPQCDDGRDNDGDGWVDYPSDSGCSSDNDNSERSNNNDDETECNDGRDNDGDGDRDLRDAGCRNSDDDSEDSDDNDNDRDRQCNDNRDNDGDGAEDYPEDRGCSSRTDNTENSDNNDDNNDKPEVITRSATGISETSATLNGRVDGNGSNTRVWFEYSDDRSDIESDEETNEDSVGSGTTSFDERITGLRRNTTYYFRAVARNGDGEDTGSILSFRTDNDNDNDDESECDDNRDNDNDNDEDYPEDEGCSSRNDNSEDSENDDNNNGSNVPPFYTSTPATSVLAGQVYSYNADAISPNGRAITYSLPTRPSGMTINEFTGQVLWSTTVGQAGTSHSVRVVATDSRGNTVTQTFSILVRSQTINPPFNPPVNPPVNPPAQELGITNLNANEINGNVVISFNTNLNSAGSVRYGTNSEINKTSNFTYPFSQISESGQATSHEVNLGPLVAGQTYYLRAFASSATRSAFSSEFTFTRPVVEVGAITEVAGTATCFDGIDNDRDGVADASDSDCGAEVDGQVAGTFASVLESFGAFLVSPWFLFLVIVLLIIYIIVTRRQPDVIATHGPIEIKS